MWDVLEVTHEGTNKVKRARKYALIQEYELFKMQKGESIAEVQKRFTHIVNHLTLEVVMSGEVHSRCLCVLDYKQGGLKS